MPQVDFVDPDPPRLLSSLFVFSMEDDESQLTPVITDDGYTFLYVKHNNLYRQNTRERKKIRHREELQGHTR